MPSRLISVLSLATLMSTSGVALAQLHPNDLPIQSPRAMGMGNAVRGDPVANNALLFNPAGMARGQSYAAQVGFHRANGADANGGVVNIVDSRTQPKFPVGVAYGYEFVDGDAETHDGGHDVRMGFGLAPVPGKVTMGVGLHYLNLNRKEESGLKNLEAFTLDAGLHFALGERLYFGLTGHNLADAEDPQLPVEFGGGVAYVGERLVVDFDAVVDTTTKDSATPRFMGGMELLIGEEVPVRAGFERDNVREETFVTAGLGFMSSGRVGGTHVNVAYRQNVEDSSWFNVVVGITSYFAF